MARRKNPAAASLGKLGGKATAKKLTPAERTESARKAAKARWALIAAAPELLEQLKLARKCIAWCRAHHKDAQSDSGGLPVETLIDAAIAKAEGRL